MPDINEEIHKDVAYLTRIVDRFDSAIDNLGNLVSTLDKMAAVQNERLNTQEEQSQIIHNRIHSMKKEIMDEMKLTRKENTNQHMTLYKRLDLLENDVYKWKWLISGIVMGLFVIFSIFEFKDIIGFFK